MNFNFLNIPIIVIIYTKENEELTYINEKFDIQMGKLDNRLFGGSTSMRIIKYGFHGEDDAQNIFLKSHFEWYF